MTGRVYVLDSEMVWALATPSSRKHRQAMTMVQADRGRPRRRASSRHLLVPSTVRVEAGWDRTAARWAGVNRLGVVDHHLDRTSTDVAARLRAEHGASPADAHIGAIAAERGEDDVVVVTSDPDGIATVTAGTGARVIRI